MVHRIPHRKQYPSDLTDEQWAILAPMIPPTKQSNRGGRPRTVNMREVLNTLFYLNRSGCQWDMLPHDLLPKSTVYDYFAQWRDDGTWTKMVQALREQTRVQAGREPTPSAICIDSQIGQDHRDGGPSVGMRGKKSRAQAASLVIRWVVVVLLPVPVDDGRPCSALTPTTFRARTFCGQKYHTP